MGKVGVYIIDNAISGHIYVGSSVNIKTRWERHVRDLEKGCHSNYLLQNSWDKHGRAAFSFRVLEIVCDKAVLLNREQAWLDKLLPFDSSGYNIYRTAGSPSGLKHSEKTRRKMSKSRKGRRHTVETRKKMSRAHKGKVFSNSHRQKMAEAQKNIPPEVRAKMTGMKGKKHSAETRRKMSESRKRYCMTMAATTSIC